MWHYGLPLYVYNAVGKRYGWWIPTQEVSLWVCPDVHHFMKSKKSEWNFVVQLYTLTEYHFFNLTDQSVPLRVTYKLSRTFCHRACCCISFLVEIFIGFWVFLNGFRLYTKLFGQIVKSSDGGSNSRIKVIATHYSLILSLSGRTAITRCFSSQHICFFSS